MDDLVAFLDARLDEDKAVALDAGSGEWYEELRESNFGSYSLGHAARHNPARVLREVAAKRAMLAKASETWHWYQRELSEDGGDKYGDGTLNDVRERWDTWEIALRCLTAVYSDHPDYRPEWKP